MTPRPMRRPDEVAVPSNRKLRALSRWLRSVPWLAVVLIALAVGVSILDVALPLKRQPTSLELALIRSIELSLSIIGAYVFGKASAREVARAMVQAHARPALRRVFALYWSLSRLAGWIAKYQESEPASGKYDTLEAIVTEQLVTANDTLEDWRDLVPDDVAELEAGLRLVPNARLEPRHD